jgi:glycosyltransferase involved in cell wall biosynthesis
MKICGISSFSTISNAAILICLGCPPRRDGDFILLNSPSGKWEARLTLEEYSLALEAAERARAWINGDPTDYLEISAAVDNALVETLKGSRDTKVVYTVPDLGSVNGSQQYRIVNPFWALDAYSSRVSAYLTDRVEVRDLCRYANAVVTHEPISPKFVSLAKVVRQCGVRVVVDLDDDVFSIPEDNPAALQFHLSRHAIEENLAAADVITVSTPNLRDVVKRLVADANVRIIPNMINDGFLAYGYARVPKGGLRNDGLRRILWAGSHTHARDLAVVAPALARVLARHKDVRFVLFGSERVPKALESVSGSVELVDPVPYASYPAVLLAIAPAFGIAPLEDNGFNRSKSAVKILEYGALRVPSLASPVGEYPVVAQEGFPVRLVDPGEWEDALESMILARPEDLVDLGEESRKWVLDHRTAAQVMPLIEEVFV